MQIKIFVLLMLLAPLHTVEGQYKRLNVGDRVPSLLVKNIANFPSGELSLTDHKYDLLILDFMATFCGSCMKKLPYYDSLNKGIEDMLILPVSPEESTRALRILEKKDIHMAFATEREEFYTELFPHTIISHFVWIMDGEVKAITGWEEVTEENVKKMLEGGINLPVKKDMIDYDDDLPLLVDGNGGGAEDLLFQSVFTKYLGAIPGGIVTHRNGITIKNGNALSFYKHVVSEAFDNKYLKHDNRIVLEVSDSVKQKIASQKNQHKFTYSLRVPDNMPECGMYRKALEDMNCFFGANYGINGEVEKRRINCLVLRRTKGGPEFRTTGDKVVRQKVNDTLLLRNLSFNSLVDIICNNLKALPTPIVSEVNYFHKIDMNLKGDLTDIVNVKKELGRYGLVLEEGVVEVEMLVIKSI